MRSGIDSDCPTPPDESGYPRTLPDRWGTFRFTLRRVLAIAILSEVTRPR